MRTVVVLCGLLWAVAIGGRAGADGGIVGDGYDRVIKAAERDLGVREEGGENCGPRVGAYLKYVGIGTPAPWCAAAVSMWFRDAGFPAPRTAWSPALLPKGRVVGWGGVSGVVVRGSRDVSQARHDGWMVRDYSHRGRDPMRGLVFGIYFPKLGRIGHCGLVEGVQGDFCRTIEGNTSVAGSREGDGVYRRLRHRRTIARFSDWVEGQGS
ncbi:peptidoglycan-binding protein [Pedobacter sp. JY14-1]|uniref:peptidoglycan-binding protein n=1 Tax=Pedobacter sp. JY14-1 TaxID=3034151 RepID=UPI0023E119E6|nr:peptidoglycan-binding protein [Pedobacter sp. JY14-1]